MTLIRAQILAACAALCMASWAASMCLGDAQSNPTAADKIPIVTEPEIWKDPSQPTDARVSDLVRRLSLSEKAVQICADPDAIPRLGIPAYSHRNECLHGVNSFGAVTVFPQAIAMAATWDTPLIHEEGDAVSTEARAKHNDYAAQHSGASVSHTGLSYYSPNLNLFRDPRWGRGQETYGEDPFLISRMGVAYITGLQGDDPKYFKIIACAKHYAVHSGPEPQRHVMDARPTERDLYETYLPAFEAAVREAHVGSVMGAYSSLYGIPDCASDFLLQDILRKQWGFTGFVVSDGGAIWDIWAQHKYVKTAEEAAAVAVKAGCDISSGNPAPNRQTLQRSADWTPDAKGWLGGGNNYRDLPKAVAEGFITEKEIDAAVSAELTARFKLGMFDPPAMVPYSKITAADCDTPAHRALAEKVAEESIVLLKNDGVLPLDRSKIRKIAVIGPNADSDRMLLGSYHGEPSQRTTILEGIKKLAGADIAVTFAKGSTIAERVKPANPRDPDLLSQAVDAAKAADVVIYVGGIDSTLESEQSNTASTNSFDGFERGDRSRIELPAVQEDLLKALAGTGKPVILVNCSGSAMAIPWEVEHIPAIVQAWYPGEAGGTAVAKALFGDVNPAGRLPITFYNSTDDLPAFDDYSMANRTYRYFNGKPLFAFGYGLSYTIFDYAEPKLENATIAKKDVVKLSITIKNRGHIDGDEVAQVYFRHIDSPFPQARLALCGFARVSVAAGKDARAEFEIPATRFRYWDTKQEQYIVEPGKYELLIGAASDDIRLHANFTITD